MEEKTADEIAAIFSAAGDSVTVIGTAQASGETDDDFKDKIKRNVEHLEIIKAYKKVDNSTSIWTSESFTAIDAAITAGKKLY
jgi:pyruvate/2-oxoglutarate dehydrogenase complex dihydrolipoamide dehydrogenase (E3) component